MKKLKEINALSLGMHLAIIYFVLGLISGLIILIGIQVPNLAQQVNPEVTKLGNWVVLVFPLAYLVTGFVSGIFIGFLYNIISKKTGGISIEISDSHSVPARKK